MGTQKMIEIIRKDSDILLVSFGGLALRYGIPIPEFKKMLSNFNVNKIFLMDKYRCWYFRIREKLITKLQKEIKDINPKRKIFFGVSAGGYAAIMYGMMFNVDQVLAFNPQTFLSKEMRYEFKDKRWIKEVNEVYKYSKNIPLDLWNHEYFKCKTLIELFYCNRDLYKIHSEEFEKRMKLLKPLIHPYICNNGVAIAKNLKETGELFNIFLNRI